MAVFKLDNPGADGRKVVDLKGKTSLTLFPEANGTGKKQGGQTVFTEEKFVPVKKLTDIADGTRETTALAVEKKTITLHPDGFHEKVDTKFFSRHIGADTEYNGSWESAR